MCMCMYVSLCICVYVLVIAFVTSTVCVCVYVSLCMCVYVLIISFVTSTVCLAPSGERQTVWAGPGNSILPTFMTSVSLGVPERGRAMWTRFLSKEGS